jgi:hypothetical protein
MKVFAQAVCSKNDLANLPSTWKVVGSFLPRFCLYFKNNNILGKGNGFDAFPWKNRSQVISPYHPKGKITVSLEREGDRILDW